MFNVKTHQKCEHKISLTKHNSYISMRGFHASGFNSTLSNSYFTALLTEEWMLWNNQYKANGKELYLLQYDLFLKYDAELAAISQNFASDNDLFLETFVHAWTKLQNSDRFEGSTGNLCDHHEGEMPPCTVFIPTQNLFPTRIRTEPQPEVTLPTP